MKFNNHIFPLLKEYDCVVIPNFGSFVCRNISAKFSESRSKLLPPNKEIVFNKNLKKNDGVLVKNISELKNISYSDAEEKINSWVKKINKKINKGKSISFENIGSLRKIDKNFIFEPNHNSIFLKSSYGLSAVDTVKINKTKIIKPSFNNTMLKYAAVLILFVSFSAIALNSYFDSVKNFNENSYLVASKEVSKKIQRATFSINPVIPLVTLPIEKKYGNFHIIAGSFRFEENSLKMINLLKKKGFIEARKVGMNPYGLIQVAYNSYDSVESARAALELLRDSEDENAWLLIKN
jgi:nucleoid DNA-binding protein